MPGVTVGHIAEPSFDAVVEIFRRWNPDAQLSRGTWEGDGELHSETVQYLWIESGEGLVFLPAGTRTQEGDGEPLDDSYRPDPFPTEVREALTILAKSVDRFDPALRQPIQAIVQRQRGDRFVGDIAGELWLILESGLDPDRWTDSSDARAALELFFQRFRQLGWSEKTTDGWEPVQAGDQLALTPDRPLRVRGAFRYWAITLLDQRQTHVSPTRRLRFLKDTAGGCNFAFDAFRRLPLTWIVGTNTPENPDGINRVNSHVVNIAAETSRTHYHPLQPIGGGKPQSEMYLVLDPAAYRLHTYGRTPWLIAYPDVEDLARFERIPLRPGSTVYIEPETGHRGIDVFVNVVTLPGFKPRNELYLDQKIKDTVGSLAPYNAALTV